VLIGWTGPRPDLFLDPEGARAEVERAAGRQSAHGKEERIARQERRDDESGFREDHEEEKSVHPGAVQGDELGQVPVQVQEQVDRQLHWRRMLPHPPGIRQIVAIVGYGVPCSTSRTSLPSEQRRRG